MVHGRKFAGSCPVAQSAPMTAAGPQQTVAASMSADGSRCDSAAHRRCR